MGFRFQKRIKLGKGFGLNISKSKITPSYRSKRGSLSSKGYSLRTGIPGLSYRKSFKKSKRSGCLVTLVLVFLFPLLGIFMSCKTENSSNVIENDENISEYESKQDISSKKKEWYQGGNLHKAKIIEWKNASDENKLATCGDFCAKIYSDNSLDEIKTKAISLMICIDEAIKDYNEVNSLTVPEVASMCIILLEN